MSLRYERPETVGEALLVAERFWEEGTPAAFLAGGTDLVPSWKRGGFSVGAFVSLAAAKELRGIARAESSEGATLSLGAMTPLSEIAANGEIRAFAPALAEAAAKIASPQIRNRATLGGNLLVNNRCAYFNQGGTNRDAHGDCFKAGGEACHLLPGTRKGSEPLCRARFVSDLAPVLILLGARVGLVGLSGWRWIPLAELYLADGIERNTLGKTEILAKIEVVARPALRVRYRKLRIREAFDFPSVGVAVSAESGNGELGVAITGVNPAPAVVRVALDEAMSFADQVEAACRETQRICVPLKQDFFPPSYRKAMIPVLIRRCAEEIRG